MREQAIHDRFLLLATCLAEWNPPVLTIRTHGCISQGDWDAVMRLYPVSEYPEYDFHEHDGLHVITITAPACRDTVR